MGDLFIEVACVDCKKMDTLYYPKEISTIKDFIDIISQKTLIKNKPIVEENMYKLQYNNMVEKALEKIGCVKNKSIKVFSNNGEVHADNTGDK
jgi:hypothetical protein